MAKNKSELDTPALIVDIDKLKFNIRDMADFAAANGIQLRPHAKTHKTPEIGKLQLEAGAAGLTVAKLGEAEVFIDAGCREILVAYPLVGQAKHRRLIDLCQRAHITTVVDHADIAQGLSRSMSANGLELPVMVEVDTGLNRCGVAPGASARDLAQQTSRLPGLRFAGLLTHEGHAQVAGTPDQVRATGLSAGQMMAETAELIRKSGLAVPDHIRRFDCDRQNHGDCRWRDRDAPGHLCLLRSQRGAASSHYNPTDVPRAYWRR